MRRSIVAVLLGLTLVLGVSAANQAQTVGFSQGAMLANGPTGAEASRRISVTGTAQVSATPNEMVALFSVTTSAPSVDECALTQARKTDRLVQALKKPSGIEAKITTGGLSLAPYAMPALTVAAPTPIPQEWVFYATVITAYADSLPTLGKVIDAAMGAGATGVGSTGFGIEPMDVAPGSIGGVFNPDSVGRPGGGGPGAPKTMPFASTEIRVAAKSASECTSRGSEIIDRVKHAITDALGGKGTVRVAMFQVNRMSQSQQYGYQQPSQSPLRQGFRAHDTVKVETKNLGLLGAIITAGMGAGADSLDLVQFTLSDDSVASKEAIDRATRDAKAKAAIVAKAMGVKLGDVMGIFTNTSVQAQYVYGAQTGVFALAQTPATRMIGSGQVAFSANVTVGYAIK